MVKRKIIIASHNKLAFGLKETLGYITGDVSQVVEISAYLDNTPVADEIAAALADVSADDEVLVLTDLLGGSVNQAFFPYLNREHFHVITGMNLPVLLSLALQPTDTYLDAATIHQAIAEGREQLAYVNDVVAAMAIDEDDE
ncbi:MAG: PTS sugar transporter subunit IIA [Pseudolactococcus laudensis]|uniref:PTS sugar transporter subunit IIA n=1 Tax=Pseudolactococcus laudensis TaxID=1494461 RepID=UPI003F9D1FA3